MGLCDCIGRQESRSLHTTAQTHTILVCLDKRAAVPAPALHGTLRSIHQEEPVPFRDLGELILKLDALCGSAGDPRGHDGCSGGSDTGTAPAPLFPYGDTFTISVERRNHATLQGRLRGGLTGGKYLAFQSALELMHILTELTEPGKEGITHGI